MSISLLIALLGLMPYNEKCSAVFGQRSISRDIENNGVFA